MGKVLIIDPAKCDGCRSCEAACSTTKEGESNPYKARIRVIRFPDDSFFYPIVCSQCDSPFCVSVCPTSATSKNPESGVVEHDSEKCVGCKMCLLACPFGSIATIDALPAKCDLCEGDPACVKFCEPGALTFAEREEAITRERATLGDRIREIYSAEAPSRPG